ncbi:MAG: methionine synthase, partial [Actinobacteria bacterium]|nr:methionine synthase [Actinomycetota bacterium]
MGPNHEKSSHSVRARDQRERADLLRQALASRVVVADGAMGTMLQSVDLTLDDFEGYEGCNEILNVTRSDVVADIHRQFLSVGVDCVETNTFGANFGNLIEYDIPERTRELAYAGARIARQAADDFSTDDRQRWVLGSVGPGTKLPTLGHAPFSILRDAYQRQVEGLLDGGVDAVLIETAQDLLQAKAALIGARRAVNLSGVDIPIIAQVTVETTGTLLLGSEIGAALTSLEPLGIDVIGLNCATGPAEMSEHLRVLSKGATAGISVMPNAGLPILGENGAHYPLSPEELAKSLRQFVIDYKVNLVGGCCGTTPAHLKEVVKQLSGKNISDREVTREVGASSLYQFAPFRQQNTFLSIGERTNANGSRAFRDALLAEDWQSCVEIARDQ